jgi:hypothetical protein
MPLDVDLGAELAELKSIPAQEMIDQLRQDSTKEELERFSLWHLLRESTISPLHVQDTDGNTNDVKFNWFAGGASLPAEDTIRQESENITYDPMREHCLIAIEDYETGYSEMVYPLGAIHETPDAGWMLPDSWVLCWALTEKVYWIIFNWEDEDDIDNPFPPTSAATRIGTFGSTGERLSYCRLVDFSFETWSGKMKDIRAKGFSAYHVTRKSGLLSIDRSTANDTSSKEWESQREEGKKGKEKESVK